MPLTPCWPPPFITSISWLDGWSSCYQIPAGSESNARPSMGLKIENFTDEDEFDETIEELSRRIALNLSP